MAQQSSLSPLPTDAAEGRAPRGFWSVTLTEFWERFSYYGLQGILTYYLLYSLADGGLELSPTTAISIVGAYGGAVYLSQVMGAWIADRLLAQRTTILVGGSIIMVGHISLALVPGTTGLFIGLAAIAIGTGLLKTNVSALVGTLYGGRSRVDRDAGFSYFYMGVNTGAVLGPLLTGFAQVTWGFHLAFGLAAIGMFFGLVQFLLRYRDLPEASRVVFNPIRPSAFAAVVAGAAVAIGVCAALFGAGIIHSDNLNLVVGGVIIAVAVYGFGRILATRSVTASEKRRIRGYLPMWVAEAVYMGLLLQIFTTIPLLVTARVDLTVGNWEIPEAWFSFVGTIALVVTLWFMGSIWKNSRVGRLTPTNKFSFGLAMIGFAYLLMVLTELTPGRTVSPWFIALCLAIAGASELFVSPIGMSLITSIAPEKFRSQAVALKILTLGVGSTISAVLGTLYTSMSSIGFFCMVGAIGIVSALLLRLVRRPIEAMLGMPEA